MRVLSHRAAADRSDGAADAAFPATPLAAKAEVVLGLQLATRHRAVRLAALLAVGIAATVAASAPSVDRVAHVMLWIAGTLAALAGSRLLASGPALAAARLVVAPWWLPPLGRLVGTLCAIVPATLGAGVAMLAASHGAAPVARLAGVVTLYAAAVAAVVMALAPLVGATGAASLGIVVAWAGAASPSTVAALPLILWALLGLGLAGCRVGGGGGGGGGGARAVRGRAAGRAPLTLVVCEDTARWFGRGTRRRRALGPVSVVAEAGEIVGIIGPNGAGKTTLLRLVAGELAPAAGRVRVGGRDAGTAAARRLVGFAPDPPLAPPALTGVEWLSYLAAHRARGPAQRLARLREAIEFGQVGEFVGRRIGEYSRGMAQRLGIAAAVLLAGTVLLLDEALAGMDPLAARDLRHRLAAYAATGRLVFVASHELGTIERLATRVLVLSHGRLVSDVSTAALLKERVVELALGGGAIGRSDWLLARYDGATRTGDGVAVPLSRGRTVEEVLAACRAERIPVAATRVRYRALEDLLVAAEPGGVG